MPDPAEVLPADEAVDRVLAWWRGGRRDGKRVAVVGGTGPERVRVLREVHRQVSGSLLLDVAAGRSQEELLGDVMDHLDVPEKQRRYPHWRRALERHGKDRLVLLTGVQRAGLTRRSAEPSRVLADLVTSLAISGIGVVTECESDPRAIVVRLFGSPEETGALPALLRVLALSEPRRVPLTVWRLLAEGAGPERPETAELLALAERHPELLAVEGTVDPVVAFRDEEVAESLRRDAERTDPGLAQRIGAHLTRRLRAAAPDFRHPGGWAASGPVGAYAAAGLAMHAVQAGLFEDDLLGDGEAVANISRTALLDAARCAFGEGMPGENAAADANYLALYGIEPAAQPEWAAWLHLMAVARGDTALASAIAGSGVTLPWTTRWTRWRPPGGYDFAYLEHQAVNDLIELRRQGRPAVAVITDEDGDVRILDPYTGQRLAGPWPPDEAIPAADQAALTWPEPEEHDEPGPATVGDIEDASESAAGPSRYDYWLHVRLEVDGIVLLAGEGGLVALDPADPNDFPGIEPCHRTLLMPAFSAPAAARHTPAHTPARAPSLSDLARLLGPDTVRRTAPEALPPALTDEAARRILTGPGLPELDEQGLGLQPRHGDFLHQVPWPPDLPPPDTTGPFLRIGEWMGGLLVLDGPTGKVLRVPSSSDEPGLEGTLVAVGLAPFLTMTAEWIVGHRTLERIGNRNEQRLVRQEIENRLSLIDPVGSTSTAWTYGLYND